MLHLLKDRVAVIPVEDPAKIGSLYIPETAKQRTDQGVIKYRGSEVDQLKVGDHVLFSGYVGSRIAVKGEGVLLVMQQDDILAVLGEGEELFTIDQIERSIEDALVALLRREGSNESVEHYIEHLRSQFRDYFEAKGLAF